MPSARRRQRRKTRREKNARPAALPRADVGGPIHRDDFCRCGGRKFPGYERCAHLGACKRRHGVDGEILTDRFGLPFCGGCRVLLGDDPDEVSALAATARHFLEIERGQLSMFAPPAAADRSSTWQAITLWQPWDQPIANATRRSNAKLEPATRATSDSACDSTQGRRERSMAIEGAHCYAEIELDVRGDEYGPSALPC